MLGLTLGKQARIELWEFGKSALLVLGFLVVICTFYIVWGDKSYTEYLTLTQTQNLFKNWLYLSFVCWLGIDYLYGWRQETEPEENNNVQDDMDQRVEEVEDNEDTLSPLHKNASVKSLWEENRNQNEQRQLNASTIRLQE